MKKILLLNFVIFSFVALNAQNVNEPFISPEKRSFSKLPVITNSAALNSNKKIERLPLSSTLSLKNLNVTRLHFKENNFIWNDEEPLEDKWAYTETSILSRSANGSIISKISVDTTSNINLHKMDYYQDQFGNDTLVISSNWDDIGSVFVPSSKQLTTYDPVSNEKSGEVTYFFIDGEWLVFGGWKSINIYQGDLLMQSTEYSWSFLTNMWVADFRIIMEYDGNNLIRETIQEQEDGFFPFKAAHISTSEPYDDSQLVNVEKTEFEYTNNIITLATLFFWDEDGWVPESRYTNIVWHDLTAFEPSSYDQYDYDEVSETWFHIEKYQSFFTGNSAEHNRYRYDPDSSGFVLIEKFKMETFPNGTMINTEFAKTESGIFVPSDRTITSFDDRGNFIGITGEHFDLIHQEWVLFYGTRNEYTYDSSDLLVQMISLIYDDGIWTNLTRTDYLNYGEISVSTIPKTIESLVVYPNPTNGPVTIKSAGSLSGSHITVHDMTGRKVLDTIASGDQNTIDLSGMSKGMYIIRVENQSLIIQLK